MNSFRTNDLLNELSLLTETCQNVVKEKILPLSVVQLKWKKDHLSWSILDVFAHLNEYAGYYHEVISRRMEKTRFREPRETFIPSPLGRSAWSSMKLGNARNVKRKLRSPRAYNPLLNPDLKTDDAIQTFLQHQSNLLNILKNAAKVNLRKVRIPISVSKIIRLRLGDALMYLIYHNERHVQQIVNIMASKDFPENRKEE
jgi:hypothetical protein